MAQRMVKCVKLGKEAPGLDKPPFGGALGQEIFEKISAQAWQEWNDTLMIKIINEYRLNMAEAKDYELLLKQMRIYLNLESAPAGVMEVENADRGKDG